LATTPQQPRSSRPEQTFEGRRENLSQANKLSRSCAVLLEALNRHRGKGQQKVTVEHVVPYAPGGRSLRPPMLTAQAAMRISGPAGKKTTLERWRGRGVGTHWYKVAGLVGFRPADIDAYIRLWVRQATSDPGRSD
jgi:hypothetical protein